MAWGAFGTTLVLIGFVGLIIWLTWPQDVGRFDYDSDGSAIDHFEGDER